MTNQPSRHTADTITDDQLDELYARIATLEVIAAGNWRHVQLIAWRPRLPAPSRPKPLSPASANTATGSASGSEPAAVHPVAANLRHFLDQPKEPRP
ncbi:hypothetical protein [Streptomyces sp. NPDC002467]|uniref:hypothetical protein n=1 Tax=Streptomyces sp. NPDC002467 TaxID=3364647 RepID=UPI00368FD06C